MCNKVHEYGFQEPIKPSGKGWKLFARAKHGTLVGLVEKNLYKREDNTEWVEWNQLYDRYYGFCFFTSKKKAIHGFNVWQKGSWEQGKGIELHPIEYRGGLVEQEEMRFVSGEVITMALCKEFRIIEKKEGDNVQ